MGGRMREDKLSEEQVRERLATIDAYESSGLSGDAFAQSRGISYLDLRGWATHAPRWRAHLIALGHKNWLFIGSRQAGERADALMTLIEPAKLYGFDPWAHLEDVFTKLPTWPNHRLDELRPTMGPPPTRRHQRWPQPTLRPDIPPATGSLGAYHGRTRGGHHGAASNAIICNWSA